MKCACIQCIVLIYNSGDNSSRMCRFVVSSFYCNLFDNKSLHQHWLYSNFVLLAADSTLHYQGAFSEIHDKRSINKMILSMKSTTYKSLHPTKLLYISCNRAIQNSPLQANKILQWKIKNSSTFSIADLQVVSFHQNQLSMELQSPLISDTSFHLHLILRRPLPGQRKLRNFTKHGNPFCRHPLRGLELIRSFWSWYLRYSRERDDSQVEWKF